MNSIITTDLLNKYQACPEGIRFFERNFPETIFPNGLDLSKVRIEGDYEGYFAWFKNLPTLEYDDNENKIKEIYPNGDICHYGYDERNNLIKETYPKGGHVTYKYDDNRNRILKKYSNGSFYQYKYINGRIVEQIDSYGNSILYEYNDKGEVIGKKYSDGLRCIYKYNDYGNLVKEIIVDDNDRKGNRSISYYYDNHNNLIKQTSSNERSYYYIFNYDIIGRLIQSYNCYISYLNSYS